MDIHGNSGANTCENTRLSGRVAIVSLRTNRGNPLMLIITMKQIADWRRFAQVSHLSAPVGKVLAYRGSDG
jgi:hypothetical protein